MAPRAPRTPWLHEGAISRLLRRPAARGALIVLGALLIACVVGPPLSRFRYDRADLALGPTPPSAAHWLGTDTFGRDLLARVLLGGRVSFAVGALAMLVSASIGVAWGAVAGYSGGRLGALMMRIVDIVDALPLFILAALGLVFVTGPAAQTSLARFAVVSLVLGALSWPSTARVVRVRVAELRVQPFVEAARALGAGHRVILFRHLLPNALGPAVVQSALAAYDVMLSEAFLSYLGLGTQEPLSSWGMLVAGGAESLDLYPWIVAVPGLFLAVTLISMTVLAEALRDALDPRPPQGGRRER